MLARNYNTVITLYGDRYNHTFAGEPFIVCIITESLCCTPDPI